MANQAPDMGGGPEAWLQGQGQGEAGGAGVCRPGTLAGEAAPCSGVERPCPFGNSIRLLESQGPYARFCFHWGLRPPDPPK
jgi:hypothetical protein